MIHYFGDEPEPDYKVPEGQWDWRKTMRECSKALKQRQYEEEVKEWEQQPKHMSGS